MPAARVLPSHPSLRHLKLEAKRRLAAGEFATLHDAQAAIAREHGLPGWTALKQACVPEGHALGHVRWIIERFRDAGQPGWTPPGDDELRQHFDDRFLAAIPPGELAETIAADAADLRSELTVIGQVPFEAQVQLAGTRYVAIATPDPPHRLIGLRGFPLAERIADPRVQAPPPVRTVGRPPPGIVAIAVQACADLGLPALLLAGGEPRGPGWAVASGHADLDRGQPLEPGHRFTVPGLTSLVTTTAVLRLVAEGRLDLDAPANGQLRAVRLADDSVTVRELLTHTGGVDNPIELYADTVPSLAELMGPVIPCGGPRGTIWPSNGGACVLGQLVADATGMPYAQAATRMVLDPLGMRDSGFPARAADVAGAQASAGSASSRAVTSYTVTRDGAFEPFPAQVSTIQAVAGLWSTGSDLVRLGTGWPTLLPPALAREAVTPQTPPGNPLRPPAVEGSPEAGIGLGVLLDGATAAYGGAGLEAVTLLRTRLRDYRTFVVLTSRAVTVESLDASLRRAWL
ncbi:MAG TPA: serine hydrolase [Streptosporangiaceae bacterium]|nr:serine hydrolase [Streptosporangiaceae bacterium]